MAAVLLGTVLPPPGAGPAGAAVAARAGPAPDAGRTALGVFGGWGAFQDAAPARCFAVAVPARTAARPAWRPFAGVVRAPGPRRVPALFARLSVLAREDAPVTLSVGERRFRLSARGSAAWSPDPATARALVAALRGQRSMSIEGVDPADRPFADVYLLAGAATAIDAATLACAGA